MKTKNVRKEKPEKTKEYLVTIENPYNQEDIGIIVHCGSKIEANVIARDKLSKLKIVDIQEAPQADKSPEGTSGDFSSCFKKGCNDKDTYDYVRIPIDVFDEEITACIIHKPMGWKRKDYLEKLKDPKIIKTTKTQIFYDDHSVGPTKYAKKLMEEKCTA